VNISPAKAPRRKVSKPSSSLRLCAFAGETSPILNALGPASFAEFLAFRAPGKILWCNFDLLRQLGFAVPQTNQLTPKLNEQLLNVLSLRAVNGDNVRETDVVKMYADKYGGDGVSPALGAGRAGFLAAGNLYVKGLGFTPLFRHNDKDDFVHSHGGVHLEDCLSEAVFGEVNHNLFTLGANRIVAIIDQGKSVTEPSGKQRHIALAVRAGAQLRPGHLLAKRARGSRTPLEMFVHITRATGQLVMENDRPNVRATMLRVIDDHARTAADSFRWRIIHGALSPSNMDFSGAMLDLSTQSTQPRTAPIFLLDYVHSAFGTEHKERGFYLAETYRRILRATDPATREGLNARWINASNEMDRAYEHYLQVRLLAAAGLKTELARHLHAEHSDLAKRFTKVLVELSALKNPGSTCVARKVVEDVSVVDIFNLLGQAPREYFGEGLSQASVLKHLKPVYKGNRFHVARKRSVVASLGGEFAEVYRELMNACTALAAKYYDGMAAMQASIIARAAFENEPIDALYCYSLYERLDKAIKKYKSTGKEEYVSDAIDRAVAKSLRSVDGLLVQGDSRPIAGGGVELQIRTIRGITYSVKAWNDRKQTRRLHVSIALDADLPWLKALTKRQIESLRYCFTTDGWKTSAEVKARLRAGVIDCELPVSCLVGRLEGFFLGVDVKARRFGGYAFVIPDSHELKRFLPQRRKVFARR
jgi:hypothetical protein